MANVNLRDLEHVCLGRDRHCFALQGDLGLLAADTYLIPTDSYGRVEDHWEWAVGHDEHGRTRQLHDAAALLATRGFAWVDGTPAGSVLALNVAGGTTVNDVASMIRRLTAALDALESGGLVSEFRARPLVAMPLIGVGQAGLGGRTGEVISALLGAIGDHFDRTPAGGFDMAIVTRDPSSIAALQHARRGRFVQRSASTTPEWLDRIVRSAREGALAVIFGAGASASLGLPMWNELLARLVESLDDPTLAEMDLTGLDPVDAATLLIEAGGAVWFAAALARLLGTPRHSLTHGLIANLRCPLTITTNYDQAFEIAAQSITGLPLSVLPWDSDSGDGPRILKLHGDLSRGQLVLSRDQFVAMHAFRRPLAGVLQSRMLIGQLLAVGTSMSDATLVHAAEEFRALIEQAQRSGAASGSLTGASPDSACDSSTERAKAGTVILTASDPARVRLLERSFSVVEGDDHRGILESARDVDVLLDWMAMQTSSDLSFALDPRYRAILSPSDQALAAALSALAGSEIVAGIPDSTLSQSLATYLRSLGIEG